MKQICPTVVACEGHIILYAICCVCGVRITETFWVCRDCENTFGLNVSFAKWPEWARFLKRDEEKRRNRRDHTIQVIPVSALSESEGDIVERELYGEPNDDTY